MKNFTIATIAAAGLSAAVLALAAPATAAPTATPSAQHTISAYEAMGDRVIVTRLSDTPLNMAEIVAVRTGAEIRDVVSVPGRQGADRQHTDRVLAPVGHILYIDVR